MDARPDERAKLKKPCQGCPLARATSTEYLNARAKSPHGARRFIGQTMGPFLLPCHHPQDAENWENVMDPSHPQCAGAAMYRDLTGSAKKMPDSFIRLKGDEELVFGSHVEYLAYHEKLSIQEAARVLRETPPEQMLRDEMAHPNLRTTLTPRNRLRESG